MTLSAELRYRLLLELSQRISRTLDLQVVLQDLLQALRPAVAYDAAGVFVLSRAVPLIRRSDPNLIAGMVQVGFDDPPADDPMLRSGKGIIGHVIHTGEVVNAPDVRLDRRYVAGRRQTRSELAVPIVSEAGVIGCLNVESDRPAAFSPEDAELLEFFASSAAVSIEKALLHRQVLEKQRIEDQLKVAREVQSGLLPGAPPRLAGYDIAAVALPTWAIGGDYYDYVPLGEGRLGLVVADVSGKGIPAALIMATFRAALRTEMRRHADLRAVADAAQPHRARVRRHLPLRDRRVRRPRPDERAPHLRELRPQSPAAAARLGRGGVAERGGPALGLFATVGFEAGTVDLAPGDRLVLYTDGVVEPTDDEDREFGTERLATAVREATGRPAAEVLRRVIDATRAFGGRDDYDDDFTLVIVQRETD